MLNYSSLSLSIVNGWTFKYVIRRLLRNLLYCLNQIRKLQACDENKNCVAKGYVWQRSLDFPILRTMGKSEKLSENLRRRFKVGTNWECLLKPFLKNCRFQDHHVVSASYLDVSPLYQGLEENPNCHRQMREKDIQEQPRSHQGSSLPWTSNCWNTSVTVHSKASFISP